MAAANSWGQADVVAAIILLEVPFAASKATTNVEQWQMNQAVHYNACADFEKGDFLPVVTPFRAFTAHFSCTTCAQMLSIPPHPGDNTSLLSHSLTFPLTPNPIFSDPHSYPPPCSVPPS